MQLSLAIKLLLSLVLGGLIGFERESDNSDNYLGSIGGIRTFALVSLFGGLSGLFYLEKITAMFLITTIAIFVFVFGYYIIGTWITKRTGMTTELSALYAFLIGFLVTSGIIPAQITIAIMVVLILVLSMKAKTRKMVMGISKKEMESFIIYAIVALVILPFLPNQSYYLADIPGIRMILDAFSLNLGNFAHLEILNPYSLWFIVVLITGLDVFGYILGKIYGNKKSFAITSFFAGFVSSTSATQSLAHKSTRFKFANRLVAAALIANLASFIQMLVLTSPLNPKWAIYIAPTILLMVLAALGLFVYFIAIKEKGKEIKESAKEQKEGVIFSLVPALKFAGLLIIVRIFTKVCLIVFGQSGFLLSSMIASFSGVDAIVVNLSEMAGKLITFKTALLTLIAVSGTNLLAKSIYSYLQGKREFAKKILFSMLAIIIASIIGYLLAK